MNQDETMLLQIVLNLPYCIFWKDKNLLYKGCSRSFAKAIGLDSPDDIVGKTDNDLAWVGEHVDDFYFEDIEIIKSGKSVHNRKVRFSLNEGKNFKTFVFNKVPLFSNGVVIGILYNCFDMISAVDHLSISSSKHANDVPYQGDGKSYIDDLCHYYESIIACLPGNVYWLNQDCVLLGGNNNLANMFGLKSRRELVGLTYEEMSKLAHWTEGQGASFRSVELEVMSSGIPKVNIGEPAVVINNEKRYFLGNKVPLKDKRNKIIGIIGISIDITERKRLEEKLEISKEQAELASATKSQFIANMSHDLRTPMHGMGGMLGEIPCLVDDIRQALAAGHTQSAEELLQQAADYAKMGESCAQTLTDFFNEILETCQLEAGHINKEYQTFDLYTTVQESALLLQTVALKKHLDLSYTMTSSVPQSVIGAEPLLKRILINLLSNALKFTHQGSVQLFIDRPEVWPSSIQTTEETIVLRLCVQDTGIGIPADELERIFDRFYRLTASYDGVYKGAGLGLYASKQSVKIMGGTIEVDSTIGEGSCFIVHLPFQRAHSTDMKFDQASAQTTQQTMTIA